MLKNRLFSGVKSTRHLSLSPFQWVRLPASATEGYFIVILKVNKKKIIYKYLEPLND